ncbi:unnamed protein product [Rangifer tarandus platyrhynchus]|uniref:Uncharacterized protein n=1 Tax=Rangifer tarandus platyrhynchus TaxID=3082113 RepID=A0AC59YXB8_RANTA
MLSQLIWGADLEVRTWPCPPTTLASTSPEALGPLLAATHNGLPGRTEGAGRGGAEMTFLGGWGSHSTPPPPGLASFFFSCRRLNCQFPPPGWDPQLEPPYYREGGRQGAPQFVNVINPEVSDFHRCN